MPDCHVTKGIHLLDSAHRIRGDGKDRIDQTLPSAAQVSRVVGEFRVVTSNPTADVGRNSGANVMLVTKSGTNEFHGNGFWFYRTPRLNANEWANNFNKLGKR